MSGVPAWLICTNCSGPNLQDLLIEVIVVAVASIGLWHLWVRHRRAGRRMMLAP